MDPEGRHRLRGRFGGTCATLILVLGAAAYAQSEGMVRRPSAAGVFYPAEAGVLRSTLAKFFDEAQVPEPDARLVACIVPHSGYEFAGAVAAHAFKNLCPGDFERVLILAPSHAAAIEGCSIAAVDAYATPLGLVPLDGEAVRRLCRSPWIEARSLHYRNASSGRLQVHEKEHSIEVLLPFLQERLGKFALIPILVGTMNDAGGKFNERVCEVIAEAIRPILNRRTLIVVSTDFTHYGNDFNFRPFADDVIPSIENLDNRAFHYVLHHDFKGFQRYLEETRNPICGREALLLFLKLLPWNTEGRLLAYETSANLTKNERRSVSYAAINFYASSPPPESARAAAPSRVLKLRGHASQYDAFPPAAEGEWNEEPFEEVEPLVRETVPEFYHAPGPVTDETETDTASPDIAPAEHLPDVSAEPSPPRAPDRPGVSVEAPPPVPAPEMPSSVAGLVTPDGRSMVFGPHAAPPVTPPPSSAPVESTGKPRPVVIKMKGTRDQQEPVVVEIQGTPVTEGTQGRAVFVGTSEELRKLAIPRSPETAPAQQEPVNDEHAP